MSNLILLIIVSVALSAIAQIVLKIGMSSEIVQQALLLEGNVLKKTILVLTDFYVILGAILYITGAALWLIVLSKVDVTYAYPFVGLGFILTLILGAFLLQEPVNLSRILGTLLIVGGILLVSQT